MAFDSYPVYILRKMHTPDKLIVVNKGALGDFLQAWPSILSLARHSPHTPRYFLGPISYLIWLETLEFTPCTPGLAKELNNLYSCHSLPASLHQSYIVWFGLDKNPGLPQHEHLNFVQGIVPGKDISPRDIYAQTLNAQGVPVSVDWLPTWQSLFGKAKNIPSGEQRVLIFPGAGHPNKKWPLPHFIELSQALTSFGYPVRFVLGPVEQEQRLQIPQASRIQLDQLTDLQRLLLSAALVIGNDSGPMHLAGYMGVPSLTIFGPTSEKQWGPIGGQTISLGYSCRPCSQTGRIDCPKPRCLEELSVQITLERALALLTEAKRNRLISRQRDKPVSAKTGR